MEDLAQEIDGGTLNWLHVEQRMTLELDTGGYRQGQLALFQLPDAVGNYVREILHHKAQARKALCESNTDMARRAAHLEVVVR